VTDRQTEALEKLNRGIQESRQEVQKRTMNLAQDYFDDSAEALKQHIKENRATLKDLPDQIPGGREEAFQGLFQELMDNYSAMEECINEARENVADLDTDRIRRQGEVDATDAARRQAQELGIDLTEIEGTGTDGRIIVSDVVEAAETMEDGTGEEEPKASEAAKRRAEEMGIDLSQVEGTGSGGQVTVKDVTSLDGEAKDQATDQAGQAAQGAQDAAGQATDQAGQVADQAQDAVGGAAQQVQDTAGQAAGQAQEASGQAIDQATGALGGVTDQVGSAAQQAQETAGQATEQAQNAVGQATGEDEAEEPQATNAARRKAEEMGVDLSTVEGTGSGGLITLKDVVGS
jgi:pyruvate/2-oxoglutarate dehydrogenase complex dihydrolipoamide acyltransferase (E2) component